MGSGAERSTSAENQTDPLPGFDTNRLFAVLVKNTQYRERRSELIWNQSGRSPSSTKKRPTGGDSAKGGIRGQRTAAKEETVVQDFQVEERVSCTLPAEPHCR